MNTERVKINLLTYGKDSQGKELYTGIYDLRVLPPNGWKFGEEFTYTTLEKMFSKIEDFFGENSIISLESKELPEEIRNQNWFAGRKIISQKELARIIEDGRKGGHILELA